MSGREKGDNLETLFSFELLVEYVRVQRAGQAPHQLAVALRLLDFPTLLIYQPQRDEGDINHDHHHGEQQHTFNRGKSCFFKMSLNTLHANLTNTPLYAMVLDVREDTPRLVGTSLISLARVMDRIRQDVAERGVSAPSSHGGRGFVGVCNLAGEKVGSISLSFKLLSLGASLLPHITESSRGEPLDSPSPKHRPSPEDSLISKEEQEEQRSQKTLKEKDSEEDLTAFCPPHLFYTNTAEERSKNEGGSCRLLNLEAFTFEDTSSEEDDIEGTSPPVMDQRRRNQDVCGGTPSVLGEAVRQLPLLNALLVELSQLNPQSPQRPLSVHPNLSWIYRPASPEASGHGNALSKTQTRLGVCSPRYCSTPRPVSVQAKPDVIKSSKSPRKKLTFGTTRTFSLRLKQTSSLKQRHRECVTLIRDETQQNKVKGKTKCGHKVVKSSKRSRNQSSSLNENVETMMQTITLEQKTKHGDQSRDSSLLERDLRCIHIPGVDSASKNKEEKERHSESNVTSQAESDSHGGSSPNASFSDSSREGNSDEEDYADDFNSLEPSEAFSPDPVSSPESSRAPCSPRRPGTSNSPSFQQRAVLPVPVKAPSSPQRALRGTHVIRPRTHASALSFSSEDNDRSTQTVRSRRVMSTESSRVERSSGTESVVSPKGQRGGSISSFEPQWEVEDELGSLDFRRGCQHISELVVNKLPGYTM